MLKPATPYRLLAPGPVPVPLEVLEALSQPMIHHRTPEFEKILLSVNEKLKKVFLTKEPVFMHASTGSGAMESAIKNTLNPGDKVLCIVSGKFGERWAEMALRHGCEVIIYSVPWGEAAQADKVIQYLNNEKNFKAVLCQACETSTATEHPIQELSQAVKKHSQALFMVDAITGLGSMPLPMDEWGLDVIVSGSQKAFMLPTGLSFIALSQKAWAANEKVKNGPLYFDLRLEKKSLARGETYFSSIVPHIRALNKVIDRLVDENLNKTIERTKKLASVTRAAAPQLGLCVYSLSPSSAVTALALPKNIDGVKLRDNLEKEYNITVVGGQDQLKGKILRIGHLGYIQNEDMVEFFRALGSLLKKYPEMNISDQQIEQTSAFVKSELEK